MSRLSFRDFCETSLRALWLNAIFHKKHIRGFRERERAEIVKNDSSVRMRRLVLFLAVAVATSPAQVPKPPWATGNSTTAKPNSTDSKNNAGPDNAAASAQASETTLKVDVKLVNVFVTVTDEHGAPVGGLKKENFTLLEDGKPQTISMFDKESALPLSIVVDVDTSLSTRKDLPLELSSARRFAQRLLDARQVALAIAEDDVHLDAGDGWHGEW